MNKLPPEGLVGAALREAQRDYQQLGELLRASLRTLWKLTGQEDPWLCMRALYDDAVIAERDGKLWRYPYTIDDKNQIAFGAAVQVEQRYVPVDGAMREAFVDSAAFVEADANPGRFLVRVIAAGLSGNGNFYPDAVLREAVPLFGKARVFAKSDAEHIAGGGKDVRNIIGAIVDPEFKEGRGADAGEIRATLQLLEPEGPIAVKLREAIKRGLTNLFGLSVDMSGPARERRAGGRTFREAVKITRVQSVDLIVEPGAGGRVINFIEAKEDTMRTKLLADIRAAKPALLDGKDETKLTDDEIAALFREAVKPEDKPADKKAETPGVTAEQLQQTIRMVEARSYARATIAASQLPQAAKDRIKARFDKEERFTEADVDAALKDEREYLAKFVESGTVRDLGDPRIEMGEGRDKKMADMLDAFFDRAHKNHRQAQSFREAYIEITGDRRVTGHFTEANETAMREALGTASWANVLGSAITRRMIADYRNMGLYDGWRRIASVVPVTDFRTQERVRFGGYGDLPAVLQADPYVAMASPTDEKATYAATKRGGTETITLEMIKNDDVGAIRRIPQRLSRAAKRTLAKFVFDFIRTNPVIYDGVALFHATHGNLGAAALDSTSLAARRVAMVKQAEKDSADRIGIGPRVIMVPPDLENAAVDLFRRNTNQDKTFIQSLSLDVLPVWYWTDTNDWALAADPDDTPGIEVGFLDGQEEPELFVQDNPTVGSMFSNDQLTYKIRHIYGGNVLDYRAFDKSVV